jgi:hypothetical protein
MIWTWPKYCIMVLACVVSVAVVAVASTVETCNCALECGTATDYWVLLAETDEAAEVLCVFPNDRYTTYSVSAPSGFGWTTVLRTAPEYCQVLAHDDGTTPKVQLQLHSVGCREGG